MMHSMQNKHAEGSESRNMMDLFRAPRSNVDEIYASSPNLTQPLMELDCYRKAAMGLHEALRLRGFHKPPNDPAAWYAYKTKTRIEKWAAPAVWTLLFLSVFETPVWCKSRPFEDVGVCRAADDDNRYIMSGVPLLPISLAVSLESCILLFLFIHFASHVRLYAAVRGSGHATTAGHLCLEGSLLVLSVLDLVQSLAGSSARFAPLLRFGLAACSVPRLQELVFSFFRTTLAVSKVGMFFLYTVVLFAWVAATIFDDEEGKDQFGEPIGQGFESFSASLYTCFTTLNTATLPDSMVPSYDSSRSYLLLWMPFIFVGAVLLKQVILAGVYNDYSKHTKNFLVEGRRLRKSGVDGAFALLKSPAPPGCNKGDVVRYQDFERLVDVLTPLLEMTVTKAFLRVLFQALDDDANGVLDHGEFQDMCDVLQFEFHITERDACLKQCMEGTCVERTMTAFMENDSTGPNLGYTCRYPGCVMDKIMNAVIGLNVVWVFTESVVDLNDWEEGPCFQYADLFFSFVYVLEAVLKLCHWSWAEYWYHGDNRFDFVASMLLGFVGLLFFLLQQVSVSMLRRANLLRLLRVLKAMQHMKFYQRTCIIVKKLLTTCREVLLLNLLVVLLWASGGVQLFGGQLVESNPRLEGKDLGYFSSHYQVFNFNDVLMGMVTLFVWTLGDWNDDIALACLELADPWTTYKALIWTFLLSYYIASPLLAYNVLSAFAIDVYQKIDEEVQNQEEKGYELCEVERNLLLIQAEMAANGLVLHMKESADLAKLRIHTALFS